MRMQIFRVKKPSCKIFKTKNCVPFEVQYTSSRNALNQMYMSFLLPVVEYASVVWDGCSEQDSLTYKKSKMKPPVLLQDQLDLCH